MPLENKLNINDPVEHARAEVKFSKAKAKELFESNLLDNLISWSFDTLSDIH